MTAVVVENRTLGIDSPLNVRPAFETVLGRLFGLSGVNDLAAKIRAIFAKPGIEPHLYTFGPGVPILGPELVVNGDGTSVDGWVGANAAVSIQSGEICNTGTGPLYPEVLQDFSTVVGKEYLVTGSSRRGTSANPAWVLAKRKLGGGNLSSSTANSSQVAAPFSFKFVAQDDQSRISLVQSSGAADTGTVKFKSITVREILGYSNTYSGFVAGNYFDSAGTTHASMDGSVGLVLDAAGSVGAELVTNGDFSGGTAGWNLGAGYSISSGKLIATASSSNGDYAFAYSSGKTYRVTYTIDSITGNVSVNLGGALGTVRNAAGTYSELITTVDALSFVRVQSRFGTASFVVDNVSVKEVTGIHATQSTPGFKPTLRKGIVNLLTWSNDLTNAVWSIKSAGATATSNSVSFTTDPSSRVLHTYTHIPGAATIAASFSAADVGKTVRLAVWDSVLDGLTTGKSGTLIIPSSGVVVFNITLSGGAGYVGVVGDAAPVTLSNPSVAIFQGTLTAAQILAAGGIPLTTTSLASSQAGPNYLGFDGSRRLVTGQPWFQMTDDHCVVAAFNPSTLGSYKCIAHTGSAGANPLVAQVLSHSDGNAYVAWRDDAGTIQLLNVGAAPVGTVSIVTAKKTGNVVRGRLNGGAWVSATQAFGTTTVTASCIGDSVPTGQGFSGRIYDLIPIKGTTSDADVQLLEKQAAAAAGIQL